MESFRDQVEAEQAARAARRQAPGRLTTEAVIDRYLRHQAEQGNRASSMERTGRRLRAFHGDLGIPLADVTPSRVASWYKARAATLAADSHRNELAEVKTFWRWAVRAGLVSRSPAGGVEPTGRRRRGKPQLRRAEARALYLEAHRRAQEGDSGALAVLALLLMGMRSGELLCRKVRDVDVGADGESVLLWVDAGKTDAARRCIEAPEPVAGLLAALARGRASGEWLWASGASCGHRRLEWAIDACRRLCTAAGVPVVTPHGLRGTWATLSREAGLATHLVARELGHAGQAVTERHYLAPGADDQARTRAALRVIAGGSKVGNESSSIHSPRSAGKGEAKKTPVKTG